MARPDFPQRKSQGAGGMTSGGLTSQLDGPPPSPMLPPGQSPTLTPGMPAGSPAGPMPSFAEMAQPMTAGTPGRATTPEVALGVYQATQTMYGMLDSFSSIIPDLAGDYAVIKDLLQSVTAKLVLNSGVSPAPAATGTNFPGGGFLSGAA